MPAEQIAAGSNSMLRERTLTHPAYFIQPCLPRPANSPPTAPKWIHEIKHDGYRIMADRRRLDGAASALFLIDGEAVVCDHSGLAVFDLIRGYRHDGAAVLCAFDLLELDGKDLRRMPIEERKRILVELLGHPHEGIAFNEHHSGDGASIFAHACALGCEGIVSKRLGSS
jgi:bifunctional non-homologous end joining protein LigD